MKESELTFNESDINLISRLVDKLLRFCQEAPMAERRHPQLVSAQGLSYIWVRNENWRR